RVGREDTDIGVQLVEQLFRRPRVLGITAAILFILGVIPGMPWFVFLLLAAGCAYAARWLWLREQRALQAKAQAAAAPAAEASSQEASWDDIVPIDVLGLEVGYRLIALVDQNADGELLKRIKAIRKK